MLSRVYKKAITASPQKIWQVLTEKAHYQRWASVFSPGSTLQGEWKEGAQVCFFDPELGGTIAEVDVWSPEQELVIRHIALVDKDGQKNRSGEMADKWIGSLEKYQIHQQGLQATLVVEVTTHPDFMPMFEEGWPEAMERILFMSEEL
ncbi:SRPBCC domain-containing protein [Vibrio sp. SCSIO 43136]|uniref:SRPBCC family protein n=1 Tax=Vibrio sp. SCSIO 43136 TaxID=2819101 RepID=UPI0020750F39|nr:SRPBCC domain-containing protein [Vibrio sp. SCSIO 43136]USD65465.1 SRPBCC domain-containing protein [Vibrio sp. SCSIO 43136]